MSSWKLAEMSHKPGIRPAAKPEAPAEESAPRRSQSSCCHAVEGSGIARTPVGVEVHVEEDQPPGRSGSFGAQKSVVTMLGKAAYSWLLNSSPRRRCWGQLPGRRSHRPGTWRRSRGSQRPHRRGACSPRGSAWARPHGRSRRTRGWRRRSPSAPAGAQDDRGPRPAVRRGIVHTVARPARHAPS